ncbi:MAG TPA: hypothetical protein VJL57_03165 [Candidatus Paceibacterota bacterium]
MKISFVLGTYVAFTALLLGFSGEAIQMAHQTVTLANAHEVRTALEIYNNEHGKYPTDLFDLVPQYLETQSSSDISNLQYAQIAGGATYSLTLASETN